MSRIGKAPITVPSGVDVTISGRTVTVKGPKGSLSRDIPGEIVVRKEESTILVERPNDERINRSLHGLSRTLVNNMVIGVTDGFTKELEIVGLIMSNEIFFIIFSKCCFCSSLVVIHFKKPYCDQEVPGLSVSIM